MRFVDTNVLLYAISSDPEEAPKAERAVALLHRTDLALSVQVLQEFYVQATRRSSPRAVAQQIRGAFLNSLLRFPVQENTVAVMRAALTSTARWRISFWDAAVVEAARAIACEILYSEDLQHGQDFDGVRIVNPFGADAGGLG